MNGHRVTHDGKHIGGCGHALLRWSYACGMMDNLARQQQIDAASRQPEPEPEPEIHLSEGSGIEDLDEEEDGKKKS